MTARVINIPNATASVTRTNINDALAALGSTNSGATEPPGSLNNMLWYDTATHILKLKAEVGSDWISIGYFDQSTDTFRIFDDTQLVDASGTATDGVLGDQTTATWQAGTGTTESLVSPSKVKAAIDSLVPDSIGVNQSWSAPSRSGNTWYQNTTGRAIMVNIKGTSTTDSYLRVGPSTGSYVTIDNRDGDSGTWDHADAIVPANHYYYFQGSSGVKAYILSQRSL